MKLKPAFLLTVLAAASLCSAQHGPPPRELMLTKRIFFALNPKVSTEITLTKKETEDIEVAFDGSLEVENDSIRLSLSGGQDLNQMVEDSMKVLTADQRGRLEEVWIQHLGGVAVADDEVAKKLVLTPAQKAKADQLVEEGGAELSDMMESNPPGAHAKIDAIRSTYGAKIEGLLTDKQKARFQELKGKPLIMQVHSGAKGE